MVGVPLTGKPEHVCPYCGTQTKSSRACRAHRHLEQRDPARGASRGVTSERELGVVAPWPEGELADRGGGD